MIASLAAHVRKHAPSAQSAKATASTSSTRICASIAEPALRPALSELPKRSNPKPTNITEQVPPRSCSVPYYAAKPLKRLQLRRSPGVALQPRAGGAAAVHRVSLFSRARGVVCVFTGGSFPVPLTAVSSDIAVSRMSQFFREVYYIENQSRSGQRMPRNQAGSRR